MKPTPKTKPLTFERLDSRVALAFGELGLDLLPASTEMGPITPEAALLSASNANRSVPSYALSEFAQETQLQRRRVSRELVGEGESSPIATAPTTPIVVPISPRFPAGPSEPIGPNPPSSSTVSGPSATSPNIGTSPVVVDSTMPASASQPNSGLGNSLSRSTGHSSSSIASPIIAGIASLAFDGLSQRTGASASVLRAVDSLATNLIGADSPQAPAPSNAIQRVGNTHDQVGSSNDLATLTKIGASKALSTYSPVSSRNVELNRQQFDAFQNPNFVPAGMIYMESGRFDVHQDELDRSLVTRDSSGRSGLGMIQTFVSADFGIQRIESSMREATVDAVAYEPAEVSSDQANATAGDSVLLGIAGGLFVLYRWRRSGEKEPLFHSTRSGGMSDECAPS